MFFHPTRGEEWVASPPVCIRAILKISGPRLQWAVPAKGPPPRDICWLGAHMTCHYDADHNCRDLAGKNGTNVLFVIGSEKNFSNCNLKLDSLGEW